MSWWCTPMKGALAQHSYIHSVALGMCTTQTILCNSDSQPLPRAAQLGTLPCGTAAPLAAVCAVTEAARYRAHDLSYWASVSSYGVVTDIFTLNSKPRYLEALCTYLSDLPHTPLLGSPEEPVALLERAQATGIDGFEARLLSYAART